MLERKDPSRKAGRASSLGVARCQVDMLVGLLGLVHGGIVLPLLILSLNTFEGEDV